MPEIWDECRIWCIHFLLIKLTLLSCLLKNTKAFYLKSLSMKIVEEDCSYDTTPDELIKSTENHTCQNFPLSFKVSDIFSPVWSHVFRFKSQINETFHQVKTEYIIGKHKNHFTRQWRLLRAHFITRQHSL